MKALALASLAGLLSLNVAFAGEHAANEDEIRRLIVGHIVSCGGANCRYGSDGSYTYNGQTPGRYTVSSGSICINFVDGKSQCDRVVVDNGSYTIINAFGQRLSFTRPDLPANGAKGGLSQSFTPSLRQSLSQPSLRAPLVPPSMTGAEGAPTRAGSAAVAPAATGYGAAPAGRTPGLGTTAATGQRALPVGSAPGFEAPAAVGDLASPTGQRAVVAVPGQPGPVAGISAGLIPGVILPGEPGYLVGLPTSPDAAPTQSNAGSTSPSGTDDKAGEPGGAAKAVAPVRYPAPMDPGASIELGPRMDTSGVTWLYEWLSKIGRRH